jgi:two-component system, NtrC family, sensor kinase
LSSLVTSVAHEVNHTFGLIPDTVVELRDLIPDLTPQQAELLEEIERLANQMVYYSNEISGYHMGEKECLDINEVVKKAVRQIPQFRLPDNMDNISINQDEISNVPLECLVDENPLTRTIRNLMINAYQALEGKDHGEIRVRTYKDASTSMAKIEISDDGCGIKPEHQHRIFEAHFTTKTGKGTGIGLWLVRTYIKSISGTIKFTSAENQGTTFTLGLPLNCEANTESSDG